MNTMPELRTALLDLLYETRESELKLILGGGYGILLKREHIRESGIQTLLTEWPEARSTNDLDLFLRPELLISPTQLKPLAEALPRLGYQVIKGAEKYQFARPGPTGDEQGSLKIDFLTGPRSHFAGTSVKVDDRRARPRPSIDLHAHTTDEAITLDDGLIAITVKGRTSKGTDHHGEIYLPHPFTFAMMKLFAYRDRSSDAAKEFGQYHALDLYAIVAMMSETEWADALRLHSENAGEQKVIEAGEIVGQDFSTQTSKGILRMRESPYFRTTLQIDRFLDAINNLFPRASDRTTMS
jgi:hypothetical protein